MLNQIVNTEQATAWNGYEGGHWADHQDRYDAVNSGFNDALLDAADIGKADRILDIGCGNGQLTRLAAQRARDGHATGLDLSAPMLERARASAIADGVANVTFEQGDAQVHPLPTAGFDMAVSRFGVMFFADPVAAFANIGRALRPGGRLVFLSMRELRGSDLGDVFTAMSGDLPGPVTGAPDEPGSGPTSLADPARIRDVLGGAGFADVTAEPVDAPQVWGRDTADAAAFLGAWGPVRHLLGQVEPAVATRAQAAMTAALSRFEEPDAVRLRGTAWLVGATRP